MNIHEAECFDLYPLLFSSKIDAAFLTAADKAEPGKFRLDTFPLVEDEVVLVTSKKHPLAKSEVVELKDLRNEAFIRFSKSAGLYHDVMAACSKAGFEPNYVYYTNYVDTCLGLVSEDQGVAFISSKIVTHILWENIAVIRIHPKIPRMLSLVIPHQTKSPIVLNFRDFIVKEAQKEGKKEQR